MNKIDIILRKEVEENRSPSVQYIFFSKDSIIHRFQFGFADIKHQIEVDGHTTYNAYSVTKTFTALAVLQLAEQNKLDIEQSVKKYLPDFPYSADITIRQLLAHSAGIPNPMPLGWIHLADEHLSFDRNSFFDHVFTSQKKIRSKPNEKYSYSNLGYVLLGWLIEKVSGLRYEQYIHNNIIEKLSVSANDLGFIIRDPVTHATGYHKIMSLSNVILGVFINKSKYMDKSRGKWKPFKSVYVNGVSYGGLIGSADGFMKYIRELLQPNSTIISDYYKNMLFVQNTLTTQKATAMCLSWFKGQLNKKTYFAHAGGGGGYYCEVRLYPEVGLGSVIMFNRTGMRDERYLDKIDNYFLTR